MSRKTANVKLLWSGGAGFYNNSELILIIKQ